MVMDETYVINQLKEDVCYVSSQFNKDMQTSRYLLLRTVTLLGEFYNMLHFCHAVASLQVTVYIKH